MEEKFTAVLKLLLLLCTGAGGLKEVDLQVPPAVLAGSSAKFHCLYNLEGDPLYTVKWYKGREEFFRYVPKEHPHTRVFPLPGIYVDISESGTNSVTLRDLQTSLSGKYRCEVTTDAPDFHTQIVAAYVQVVDLPVGSPEVIVEKASYALGDTLRANCTAPTASLPLHVSWLLNGHRVNESHYTELGEDDTTNGTIVTLHVEVDSFQEGKLRLQCLVQLYDIYSSEHEVWLDEDRPRLASVLGTREASSAEKCSGFKRVWIFVFLVWFSSPCTR